MFQTTNQICFMINEKNINNPQITQWTRHSESQIIIDSSTPKELLNTSVFENLRNLGKS